MRLGDQPIWLLAALGELGTRVPDPRIGEYIASVGGKPADDWCAAFVHWSLLHAGVLGTGKRTARSYRHWGVEAQGQLGAVVVLWRESPASWKGHVGFRLEEDAKRVRIVGGNQGRAVSIRWEPKARVLATRWPIFQHSRLITDS